MNFKYFCVIMLGNPEGSFESVTQISETRAREIHSGGLLIVTFGSSLSVSELGDYFRNLGKNFILFELNDESSVTNITKGNIQNQLFDYIKKDINIVNKENINNITVNIDDYLNSLSKTDTQLEINQLIDKGIENLSEHDKMLLNKLSSKLL